MNDYFQDWYEENRSGWNERRRKRYQEDEEYREKVLAWNRRAKQKKLKEKQREKALQVQAQRVNVVDSWKTFVWVIDGKETRLYTVGALAKIIGRGISTIRVWEKEGILPETPYRTSNGVRLYTVEMIEQVREELRRVGKLGSSVEYAKAASRMPFVVKSVKFKGVTEPVKLKLYKFRSLSITTGRSTATLANLEKQNRLPRTPFTETDMHHRLYTLEMMDVVCQAFRIRGGRIRGEKQWYEFKRDVETGWDRLGVWTAELLEEEE